MEDDLIELDDLPTSVLVETINQAEKDYAASIYQAQQARLKETASHDVVSFNILVALWLKMPLLWTRGEQLRAFSMFVWWLGDSVSGLPDHRLIHSALLTTDWFWLSRKIIGTTEEQWYIEAKRILGE